MIYKTPFEPFHAITRIWHGMARKEEFIISVRPPLVRLSVRLLLIRPSVSAFYPNPGI